MSLPKLDEQKSGSLVVPENLPILSVLKSKHQLDVEHIKVSLV